MPHKFFIPCYTTFNLKYNNMDRNISESPERWVIVKLPNNYYKVFGFYNLDWWLFRW